VRERGKVLCNRHYWGDRSGKATVGLGCGIELQLREKIDALVPPIPVALCRRENN
jgi:hypothetical protein